MNLTDFDYDLPSDRIAQEPLPHRDASKLMFIDRSTGEFQHTLFSKIGDYFKEPTLFVFNNTKVIPARLIGKKKNSGGRIELLLISEKEKDTWEVLAKPKRSLKIGTLIEFGKKILSGEVVEKPEDGNCLIHFTYEGLFSEVLVEVGIMPLPPYIRRNPNEDDKIRYQSVYASQEGAIAAPTAGLHFTTELLEKLKNQGIDFAWITLHVGIGTFQPVKVDNIQSHKMHAEFIDISETEADRIRKAKEKGTRIVAVGTTVVRSLETAATDRTIKPYTGHSELFIYPGYQFKIVDALITNFHLPKSTLLMLVSAFADTQLIKKAYTEALTREYRFYSYGDAMLIH